MGCQKCEVILDRALSPDVGLAGPFERQRCGAGEYLQGIGRSSSAGEAYERSVIEWSTGTGKRSNRLATYSSKEVWLAQLWSQPLRSGASRSAQESAAPLTLQSPQWRQRTSHSCAGRKSSRALACSDIRARRQALRWQVWLVESWVVLVGSRQRDFLGIELELQFDGVLHGYAQITWPLDAVVA